MFEKISLQNRQDIKGAIVEAIAFFDLFDVYLNGFDIWQSLKIKISLGELLDVLENDLPKGLSRLGSFYFLQGREEKLNNFYEQYEISESKVKKAKKIARMLKYINGIKMIAVCNNFYYKKDSDIDLFIVIKRGKMWSSRLFATIFAHILGFRRYGSKIANRACLSFYITEDNIDLDKIRLKGDDPYFNYWFKHTQTMYDDGIYEKFFKSNLWIKESLPNMFKQNPIDSALVLDNNLSRSLKKINSIWFDSFLGDILERIFKKIQLKKMAGNFDTVASKNDTRVIITDNILKFHENDRREEFRERLKYNLEKLKV